MTHEEYTMSNRLAFQMLPVIAGHLCGSICKSQTFIQLNRCTHVERLGPRVCIIDSDVILVRNGSVCSTGNNLFPTAL